MIKWVTQKNFDPDKHKLPDQIHERLTATIVAWTGYEYTENYTTADWEEAMEKSLHYLNDTLGLGFSEEIIQIKALCYTALSAVTRYGGDAVIEPVKGENTGVHSLHTMVKAFQIYREALLKNPGLKYDWEFFANFQKTCAVLSVHDFGEGISEPGSLAQEANHNIAKDKPAFERAVLVYMVNKAIQTVLGGKPHQEFHDYLAEVRAKTASFVDDAFFSEDETIEELLRKTLGEPPKLNRKGQKILSLFTELWDITEFQGADRSKYTNEPYTIPGNLAFIGGVATLCEKAQGTAHINRHGDRSSVLHKGTKPAVKIPTASLMPGYRMITNAAYCESGLGDLFKVTNSCMEMVIAKEAQNLIYRSVLDFFAQGPEAFFHNPDYRELAMNPDGTPYTEEQIKIRLAQIDVARRFVHEEEEAKARDDVTYLSRIFNKASLPGSEYVTSRKQAITMYEKALAEDYVPKPGEVLLADQPEALCGKKATKGPELGKFHKTALPKAKEVVEMKPAPAPNP